MHLIKIPLRKAADCPHAAAGVVRAFPRLHPLALLAQGTQHHKISFPGATRPEVHFLLPRLMVNIITPWESRHRRIKLAAAGCSRHGTEFPTDSSFTEIREQTTEVSELMTGTRAFLHLWGTCGLSGRHRAFCSHTAWASSF